MLIFYRAVTIYHAPTSAPITTDRHLPYVAESPYGGKPLAPLPHRIYDTEPT